MEHGGGEFLTLSDGILNLERRWKLFPVGSQEVVCTGVIWDLKMSESLSFGGCNCKKPNVQLILKSVVSLV